MRPWCGTKLDSNEALTTNLVPVIGSKMSMGPRLLLKENACRAGEVGTLGRTLVDVVSGTLTALPLEHRLRGSQRGRPAPNGILPRAQRDPNARPPARPGQPSYPPGG